jgi:predicted nucleic acid-binding protein
MPRVVISDASPLHYLILIGHAEVLPTLYAEVLIPEAVATRDPDLDLRSGAGGINPADL